MFDIKLIREDPDMVRSNLEKRQNPGVIALLDKIIIDDKKHRETLQQVQSLKNFRMRKHYGSILEDQVLQPSICSMKQNQV